MKGIEKIAIIDDIGRELQRRMTFSDIMSYFKTINIKTDHLPSYNSKYVYVKEVLANESEDMILQIASELDIKHNFTSPNKPLEIKLQEPTFWKPGYFKLFISHLASFKKATASLKNALDSYGISAFVAHQDIEPTKEWQAEIESGLFTMEALCAILMPDFNLSKWTDQEIGVAVGRNVLIIPIRNGLDPYGFIGKYQGFQAIGKKASEVAHAIFVILSSHPKTSDTLILKLSELLLLSSNIDDALVRIAALKQIKGLTKERVMNIHQRLTDNAALKSSKIIIEFNKIAKSHNVPELKIDDFDKRVYQEEDDLPF